MGPRWGQDGSKSRPRGLPETLPSEKKRKKHQDGLTNPKILMFPTLLDPILEAQGRAREAQDLPREAQELPRSLQKWSPELI